MGFWKGQLGIINDRRLWKNGAYTYKYGALVESKEQFTDPIHDRYSLDLGILGVFYKSSIDTGFRLVKGNYWYKAYYLDKGKVLSCPLGLGGGMQAAFVEAKYQLEASPNAWDICRSGLLEIYDHDLSVPEYQEKAKNLSREGFSD